jgi:DNA-binding CsgD family transcriptional regulator
MSFLSLILAKIRAAVTLDDFRAFLPDVHRHLGYDAYTYAGMRPTESRHLMPVHLGRETVALTDMPDVWLYRYLNNCYAECDPVFRAATASLLPVVWGPDLFAGGLSSEEEAMMRDASDHGIRYGLCVAVRAGDGTLGMYAMTAGQPRSPDEEAVNTFHLIAIHLHEVLRRYMAPPPSLADRLTPRELDVLMWSADGKSATEIATILGVAPPTVKAHMRAAMQKLGVHSKTHAVARFLISQW